MAWWNWLDWVLALRDWVHDCRVNEWVVVGMDWWV